VPCGHGHAEVKLAGLDGAVGARADDSGCVYFVCMLWGMLLQWVLVSVSCWVRLPLPYRLFRCTLAWGSGGDAYKEQFVRICVKLAGKKKGL
jgi:hypothetical protein